MSGPTVYRAPRFTAPIDLDLSRNEGRPADLGVAAMAETLQATVARYPDTTRLREMLASRIGVGTDRLLVTAGGDDALLRCFMSFAGSTVVASNPTFEMVRRYAEQTGTRLVEVGWWEGPFPRDAYLEAADGGASVAVVVSPNNPTGLVASADDLRALAERFETVILDAAYTEFADEDLTPVALGLPNVITVRTLSKAFGLAGLRVGYALAAPEVITRLTAYGNPYSVSAVSAALAVRALEDAGASGAFVNKVRSEREELRRVLESLGVEIWPSQGNFVLARPRDAAWLAAGAASLGVALRWFPGSPELGRFVRIGLPGSVDDFDRLTRTLRTVLAPEAILFDLDGVIAADNYTETVIATARAFGVDVTIQDVWQARAKGNANDDWELTRRLLAAGGVDLPYDTVRERFEEIYQGTPDRPGLKEAEGPTVERSFLEKVAARRPIALVTGRPRSDALEFCDRFGITDVFGAIVTREDAPMKPDPAPVTLALERLGAGTAWMLGDTVDDLAAARAAGVLPIGVISPHADPDRAREQLSAAAVVLDTTARLIEVLDAQEV